MLIIDEAKRGGAGYIIEEKSEFPDVSFLLNRHRSGKTDKILEKSGKKLSIGKLAQNGLTTHGTFAIIHHVVARAAASDP